MCGTNSIDRYCQQLINHIDCPCKITSDDLDILYKNVDQICIKFWVYLINLDWTYDFIEKNFYDIPREVWSCIIRRQCFGPLASVPIINITQYNIQIFINHPEIVSAGIFVDNWFKPFLLPLLIKHYHLLNEEWLYQLRTCEWAVPIFEKIKSDAIKSQYLQDVQDDPSGEKVYSNIDRLSTDHPNQYGIINKLISELELSKDRIESLETQVGMYQHFIQSISNHIGLELTLPPVAKSVDEMIDEAVETVAGAISDDDFSRDECRKWFARQVSRNGRIPDDALIQTYLYAEWNIEWERNSFVAVGDALMSESVSKGRPRSGTTTGSG
jgi:hypothetical protein